MFSKLDESIVKKTHHKIKTLTKEKKNTQNPSSFSLFIFVVLLPIDVSAHVITILFLCSRNWLLSYVPPCHENLESRFTTNPLNGVVNRLPTRLLYIEMEMEPFFPIS
jgi:hypothetical protein